MEIKKRLFTIAFMVFVMALIVLGALFLPERALSRDMNKTTGTVQYIPAQYYLGENSATAKMASSQMSEYEKLQLINHVFEGESKNVVVNFNEEDTDKIIEFVREKLRAYYKIGLYPTSFDNENGADEYTCKVTKYRSLETTFNTFSTYYYKVELKKNDYTQNHTILISEGGTLLYAKSRIYHSHRGIIDVSQKYMNLPFAKMKRCSYIPLDEDTYLKPYDEVDFPKEKSSVGLLVVGSNEADKDNYDSIIKNGDKFADEREMEAYYIFQSVDYIHMWISYEIGIVPYDL